MLYEYGWRNFFSSENAEQMTGYKVHFLQSGMLQKVTPHEKRCHRMIKHVANFRGIFRALSKVNVLRKWLKGFIPFLNYFSKPQQPQQQRQSYPLNVRKQLL